MLEQAVLLGAPLNEHTRCLRLNETQRSPPSYAASPSLTTTLPVKVIPSLKWVCVSVSRGQINSWVTQGTSITFAYRSMATVMQQSCIINRLICLCKVSCVLCYTCRYTVAKISRLKAGLLLYTRFIYFWVPWKASFQEIFLQLYRSFAFSGAAKLLMNPTWHLQCLGPPGSSCGNSGCLSAKPTPTSQQQNLFQEEKFLWAPNETKNESSNLLFLSPDNIRVNLNSWACACSTVFSSVTEEGAMLLSPKLKYQRQKVHRNSATWISFFTNTFL